MERIRKVGICKYTGGYGLFELRIRTREGTICWKVDIDEFMNGWFSLEEDNRKRVHRARWNGYIDEWERRHGREMPREVREAVSGWMLVPSTLERVGKRRGHGVEWLMRRKVRER